MRKRLRLILVSLLFALLFIYAGVNSYFFTSAHLAAGFPGWFVGRDGRVLTAQFGFADPASALQDGDEIVALDGQPFRSRAQYFAAFNQRPPGHSYTITIRRAGQPPQEFTFQTIPLPRLLLVYSFLAEARVVTFIWLIVAFAIFLLRPDNKQALLLALLLGLMAVGADPAPNLIMADLHGWQLAPLIAAHGAALLSMPLMLHFFLIFPERSTLLRRFPQLEYLLYLPFGLGVAPFVLLRAFRWAATPERFWETAQDFPLLALSSISLMNLYIISALTVLAVNYRRASQPARRKIRIVVAGTIAGFLPFIAVKALEFYWGEIAINNLFAAVAITTALMLLLPPLSFAYAIARHQVIPVSLIIRRSVQYLLAKNALRLLIALPVAGALLTLLAHPNRTATEILFSNSIYFYLLLSAALALGLLFRRPLSEWIDRKFFREAYQQEKILRGLIEGVKRLDSTREIARVVGQEIDAALHPQSLYLFRRAEEERDLSLDYSLSASSPERSPSSELRIPAEFNLLRFMELQGGAQDFPFPPKTNLPQREKDWLAALDARLIVPMLATDERLSGLLLLGEKRSEVPFTKRDRELLETLADQVAFVYENVRLKQRVERERKLPLEAPAPVAGQQLNVLKECPRCGSCFDMAARTCATDGAELTLSLPIERTIEGRYRLDRLLGKGGMGAVYAATDLRLRRRVAVKLLTGSMFGDPEALHRFEREAQAAARLQHPHIISVHDYGTLGAAGAYLVMELVAGETLAARLKRQGHLSPADTADLFDQMLAGIEAAHAAGIVHRDLKPVNIMLAAGADGRTHVRILDFGLAKLTQGALASDSLKPTSAEPATTPGAVMGTFGYMSPEQLTGGAVDERSDLFSLGVMVVEALTGRRPFAGWTYHELLMKILHSSFHLQDDSPAAQRLDQKLQKCLAKDPPQRYATAARMRQELIPAIRDCAALAAAEPVSLDAATFILNE